MKLTVHKNRWKIFGTRNNMKNLGAAAIIFFSSLSGYSACDKAVTRLVEGSPALCTGYLFTPEKELEVRLKVSTYDQMEQLVKKQEELNNILTKRVDNLQDLNLKYSDRESSRNFYEKFIYFGLGALVTGFIAANVK